MSQNLLATDNNKNHLSAYCGSTTWRTQFPSGGCASPGSTPKICSTFEPFLPSSTSFFDEGMSVSSENIMPRAEAEVAAPEFVQLMDYSAVPIESLAQRHILDTMPVSVEDYYGESDLVKLRAMLESPAFEGTHRTIAALIGLISRGADEDVDALEMLMRLKSTQTRATHMQG